MGFGVPLDSWLRGPLRDWAEDLLDERRLGEQGFFKAQPVRAVWDAQMKGQPNAYKLWPVLMFQSWLEPQAPAAIASRPNNSGLIPSPPAGAATGATGTGCGAGGGGTASSAGSTQPVGACAAAAAAAAPHIAAAGAPPLIAVRITHGLTCGDGAAVAATAAVELNISDPPTNTPRMRPNRASAIAFLRHGRVPDPASRRNS
jgi:hypothetical protein